MFFFFNEVESMFPVEGVRHLVTLRYSTTVFKCEN